MTVIESNVSDTFKTGSFTFRGNRVQLSAISVPCKRGVWFKTRGNEQSIAINNHGGDPDNEIDPDGYLMDKIDRLFIPISDLNQIYLTSIGFAPPRTVNQIYYLAL